MGFQRVRHYWTHTHTHTRAYTHTNTHIGVATIIALYTWQQVAQSCPTLYDSVDCSPPSSSIHRVLQARIPEWVAVSFSRGSSQPRDRIQVSHIAGRRFNLWATREALTWAQKSPFCQGLPTLAKLIFCILYGTCLACCQKWDFPFAWMDSFLWLLLSEF